MLVSLDTEPRANTPLGTSGVLVYMWNVAIEGQLDKLTVSSKNYYYYYYYYYYY
jgi:hypothetical protein